LKQTELAKLLQVSDQTISIVMNCLPKQRGYYSKRLMSVALEMSQEEFLEKERAFLSRPDSENNEYRLSSKEAADIIGYKPQSMIAMRHRGNGPPFSTIQLGNGKKSIRYRLKDLEDWVSKRKK
jgi:hypothetical protein